MFYDYSIIGSGIVGISVAFNILKKHPKAKVILLEKESGPLNHQSSHNSGVIHSGLYYPPNSQKAKFCKLGLEKTYSFCKLNNINFNQCGKLIVATNTTELNDLHSLYANANNNSLSLEIISKSKLKKMEPNILGYEAIYSPKTGIIDWADFGKALLEKYILAGGYFKYNFLASKISEDDRFVQISDYKGTNIKSSKMISCGGLQSDRLARLVGINPGLKIIPFRGDYFKLKNNYSKIFNHLIYPVPGKGVPFLGIHFTKTLDGSMIVGPNASINFSRENYDRFILNFKDIFDYIFYKGFWKLLINNKKFIFDEFLTSFFKFYYLNKCSKYLKGLSKNDLQIFKAGIRAQAVMTNGSLAHDFIFENTKKSLFVINAPSPAATSSLPIGEYIVDKVDQI
jgi:L-2-hydroxyglutarate oxidase